MVNTMQAITSYTSAFLEILNRRVQRPGTQTALKTAAAGAAGFFLSAACLAGSPIPLALGLLCASPPGLYAGAVALGGCLGYAFFWRETQGLAWMALGWMAVFWAGDTPVARQQRLLLPALAAVVASGSGLGFLLLFQDDTPVGIYLLRVVLSAATTACFQFWRASPKGPAGWLVGGLASLAFAGIAPENAWSPGFLAAGFFCARCSLPMAAMAGLGLDLAQAAPAPMTGVLALGFVLRLIPGMPGWAGALCPGLAYGVLSLLTGRWEPVPLPGLLLGGLAGVLFPGQDLPTVAHHPKGSAGLAQVRLEQAASAMAQLEHSLLLARDPEIDSQALLHRAASESCDTCPERKGCKARSAAASLPPGLLQQPGLQPGDLPAGCKKQQRLLQHLRRAQEQYRAIRASRTRLRSYRSALADQYQFLSQYLRELSDGLCAIHRRKVPRFTAEIGVSAQSLEECTGDKWTSFSPREGLCCFLLCDGMGTGEGAARDASEAIGLIQTMLEAGFSPEQALRSFNSLSALRMSGGSATVDLVQLDLRSGSAALYKWGAGASYLLHGGQLQKIGTAGAPPGLSQQARESEYRLSLGGEDMLILLSDGAGAEGLARPQWPGTGLSAGELAASILAEGVHRGDDATVAVIKLRSLCPDTPYHIATA